MPLSPVSSIVASVGGQALDLVVEPLHRRRAADQVDQPVALADLGREPPVLALEPARARSVRSSASSSAWRSNGLGR